VRSGIQPSNFDATSAAAVAPADSRTARNSWRQFLAAIKESKEGEDWKR